MKKVIIIIVGAVILVSAGILFFSARSSFGAAAHNTAGGDMTDPDTINRFEFQRSGSSMNSLYRLTFEANRLTVEKSDKSNSKPRISSKDYKVSSDVHKSIEKTIKSSGMREWSQDFPLSEDIFLDGETAYVTVSFADGTNLSFDSSQVIPDGGWESVYDVVRQLKNCQQ